jgi:hypothetical protein
LLSAPVALLLALFGIFLSKQDLQVFLGHPTNPKEISLALAAPDSSASAPF